MAPAYESQAALASGGSERGKRRADSSGSSEPGGAGGGARAPQEHGIAAHAVQPEFLVHEGAGEDLVGGRRRERLAEADEAGSPFGAEIRLVVQPTANDEPSKTGPLATGRGPP